MVTEDIANELAGLQGLLRETSARAQSHRVTYQLDPFPGFQAASEQAGAVSDGIPKKWVTLAFSVPWVLLSGAEEHIDAMVELVPSARRISLSVLARGALELSARAWWHLDPAIDFRERVRRGLAEHIVSQLEMSELLVRDPEKHAAKEARIAEIVQEVGTLGFSVKLDRKNRNAELAGARRPGSGRLIREMLASSFSPEMGPFMWRHTSAVAHGALYALLQSYEPAPDPFGDDEMARPVVKVEDIKWPVAVAAIGHAEAFERMVRMYGWDVSHWREWRLHIWRSFV